MLQNPKFITFIAEIDRLTKQSQPKVLTRFSGAVDHITWSSFHTIRSTSFIHADLKVEFDSSFLTLETAVSDCCSTVRLREV